MQYQKMESKFHCILPVTYFSQYSAQRTHSTNEQNEEISIDFYYFFNCTLNYERCKIIYTKGTFLGGYIFDCRDAC